MSLLKKLFTWFLEWLFEKIWAVGSTVYGLWKKDREAEAENERLRKRLEESKTEEEQQDATDDLADRLRGKR